MKFEFIKKNYHIIAFILLYLSLLLGFFLDENTTIGPKRDFAYALKHVALFEENFFYTFLNYDNVVGSRISPIFYIIIYFFKKIFISIDLARFALLNIFLLTQVFFYKCLKRIFYNKYLSDKKALFLLSSVIFLSPSFRSNSIWPESAILGLLLFLIGVYYFLKNEKKFNEKNIFLNIFFIAMASYIRPSYCLFAIFFFYKYFFEIKDKKLIAKIILLNAIIAFPAFYYVFILDIFFISEGTLSSNYFNKIGVITPIIFFHTIPILFYKKFYLNALSLSIDLKLFIIALITSIIVFFNFDYNLDFAGGGIFLHASYFIFDNNLLFFVILPILLFFVLKIISISYKTNLFILILLVLLTPQYHIFHKYYDPLVLILCFTIFDFNIGKDFFKKKIYISTVYGFYMFYYLITLLNYNYIKF